MVGKAKTTVDPVVAELNAIKRPITLQLLRDGATQAEVALALQIDRSAVSRLFPAKKISSAKDVK